jgi:AcrR family transcriptional regulator
MTLTPRKQPQQSRSAHTVAAIMEGAIQVLEHSGIDGFTTNAIAERAGVSVGTLYQYFADKHAIAAAVSRQVRGQLAGRMAATVDQALALLFRDGTRLIVAAALETDLSRPQLARVVDLLEVQLGLETEGEAIDGALAVEFSRYLAQHFPHLPQPALLALADDLRAVAGSLANAAARRGHPTGEAMIDHIADIMVAITRAVGGQPASSA